jgi:predicted nucleic acid-binding protein
MPAIFKLAAMLGIKQSSAMKEKVYLDSTIPSYYFDERESLKTFAEVTRKWWSEMTGYYELYISDAVLQELSSGNYPRKRQIIELISTLPLLPLAPDLEQVVEFYIANYVMPRSLVGDAVHLAYASYFNIQYLLTWNCNHLANANKRKHIRVINGRLGLSTPEIVTPLELFKEDNDS